MPRPLLTRSAAAKRATAIAASALILSGLSLGSAAASVARAGQPGENVPVSLAITSVSPDYATPGKPVKVSGTLTNVSAAPLSGLSIQLRSSALAFGNRTQLGDYAAGGQWSDDPVGPVTNLTKPLAPHATVNWSITLPGSQLPMSGFGVYPLAAEVDSPSQPQLAVNRTFLPFWPGKKNLGDPVPQDVAWLWPLIDQPTCPGLVSAGLATSVGTGGRLSGLVNAGRAYPRAHLTWVIDPAVLANVAKMSKPYSVGGTADCRGSPRGATRAASAWLAALRSATAGQQTFVTPYDDANIAALTRYGLNADLAGAFADGREVAAGALGRSFSPAAGDAAASTIRMAWPANGSANRADLADLAASEGIGTVVLAGSTMPPSPPQNYTPPAQTTVPDGRRSGMTVLLSDDTITAVISSANSPSDSQAKSFSVAQRYLAETAMIAAEQPNLARSIVIAPPRRWNPPAGLADGLLQDTVSAPWLRPVSLSDLAAVKHPAGQVARQPLQRTVSDSQLGRSLVNQVRQLDQQVQLLKSIQEQPAPGLDRGMFAIESSAWADGRQAGQVAFAQQISSNLAGQESRLKILVPGGTGQTGGREQLTGKTGTVPVSIANRGHYNVEVRLDADPGAGLTVPKQPGLIKVPADAQVIVKLQVTASGVGSSTLILSLLTPGGTPIPDATTSMTIQATHYGTLALVIIAAVLGVFMISSGVRTFRRRGRRARDDASSADPAGASPGPDEAAPAPPDASPAARDPAAGWSQGRDQPEKADTVMSDRIKARRASTDPISTGHVSGHDPAVREGTDDYAWTPGWTDRR